METQLNVREAAPSRELTALTERFAALVPESKIDWSDSWSDEDLMEFTAASVRRLDAEESEPSQL